MGPSAHAIAWAVLTCALAPAASAAAQDAPHVVWIARAPGPEGAGRAQRWQRRVARTIEARGGRVAIDAEGWAHGEAGIAASRLARLAEIESLLRRAREERAALDHAGALAHLVEAERIALLTLEVPGAFAWYAEVEIAIAVAADESGRRLLADQAIARAASVDPDRAIGAAEAPPELLARAQAIARAIATGPRGRFEVRTSVPASVWLDDRHLGESPIRVEASPGAHVVRIEAPGHRAWARMIDVLEGGRPAIDVALSPEPSVEAARALRAASDRGDVAAIPAVLARLVESERAPRALWLVEVGEGAIERAIVIPCRAAGCEVPIRLEGRAESALPDDPDREGDLLAARDVSAARDWLDEPIPVEPPPPPPTEWWQEPWPWAVAGVVVAGAIGAAIGATYQEPPPQVVPRIDGTSVLVPAE